MTVFCPAGGERGQLKSSITISWGVVESAQWDLHRSSAAWGGGGRKVASGTKSGGNGGVREGSSTQLVMGEQGG